MMAGQQLQRRVAEKNPLEKLNDAVANGPISLDMNIHLKAFTRKSNGGFHDEYNNFLWAF